MTHRRARSTLLGLAVALALADSSVVTLALPDVIRRYDVSITDVAWVLTSYNLALAAVAVPSARLARRWPRGLCAAGLLVFAGASLACGLATSFGMLLGARCVQALGAAMVIATALILLAEVESSKQRAARVWARAGILGAALGPAVGGVLTQALGWESIFLLQAPVALLPLAALPLLPAPRLEPVPAGRPHLSANVALLLGSAALSAALFLLVILLVNGWALDPAAAGTIVTVLPLAAIAVGALAPRIGAGITRATAGLVLIAGGLAALGLLPHAGWAWTVAPQVLVGAGLGLAVPALTESALAGRSSQAVHGGWTIASRHAGVVLGLLVLTPLFTVSLERNQRDAMRAGAGIVLDSEIAPLEKIEVARDVLRAIDEADGRLPDVRAALAGESERDSAEVRVVAAQLQEQLERAVTSAFGPPFLLGAGFALAALAVVGLTRNVEP